MEYLPSFKQLRGVPLRESEECFVCFTYWLDEGVEQRRALRAKRSHSWAHPSQGPCIFRGDEAEPCAAMELDDTGSKAQTSLSCPLQLPLPESTDDTETDVPEDILQSSAVSVGSADSAGEEVAALEDVSCTLVVRNIPSSLIQRDVRNQLKKDGFDDDVEAMYMPTNFSKVSNRKKPSNKGFAFITVTNAAVAEQLRQLWARTFALGRSGQSQALSVVDARVQGRDSRREMWRSSKASRIRSADYKPFARSGPGKDGASLT